MPTINYHRLPPKRLLVFAMLLLFSCSKRSGSTTYIAPGPQPVQTVPGINSYLALGDSYTIGQSVDVADRFPVQVVRMLRTAGFQVEDPEIVATSGWTTGNLLHATRTLSAAKKYDVVTLLIGVNNQYQGRSLEEYRTEFATLLDKAIAFAQGKPASVIVLSIPDYSVTPFAQHADRQRIAEEIDSFNKANKEISERYKVNYVDVTTESRKAKADPQLVASDGLHFSGKAYKVWSELLLPVMKDILK